jgi:hypothetical protein
VKPEGWRNPERNNDGQERKAKEGGIIIIVIIIILHGALIIPWDAGGSGGGRPEERGWSVSNSRGLLTTMVTVPPTTGPQSYPSEESRQLTYSHPGEVGDESSGLHMSPQSLSSLAPFT